MAEVVANTGVSKDKGYLYYLGKDVLYAVHKWLVQVKAAAMQKKLQMLVSHENQDIFTT